MTLNRQLRYSEHDRQPLLDGVNDPSGHLRGGVPIVGADRAPAKAAAAAGLVAHQLVNHPGRDAGVLQPGRVGVPEVMSAVQLHRIQQGITGDRQRRPPAGQLVLVVVVDRGQAGSVQFAQGGRDGGRTDRAAASRGESDGKLVDALRPAVAEEQQDAPGRRSQRGGWVQPQPTLGARQRGRARNVGDPGLPPLGTAREAVAAEVRRVLEVLGQGRAAPPSSRKS